MTSGKAMDCSKANLKRNYWQEAVKVEQFTPTIPASSGLHSKLQADVEVALPQFYWEVETSDFFRYTTKGQDKQ